MPQRLVQAILEGSILAEEKIIPAKAKDRHMTEDERNELAEPFKAEITGELEAALDRNAELSALLVKRGTIWKERESIAQGLDALTEELARINDELTQKKRSLCLTPLKAVKANKEIADLEGLAETTRASIETMTQQLNMKDSELAERERRVLHAICHEHKSTEIEVSKKYQAKIDALLNEALGLCEAYMQVTDKVRWRYGIRSNDTPNFPPYRCLKMGSGYKFSRFMDLPVVHHN